MIPSQQRHRPSAGTRSQSSADRRLSPQEDSPTHHEHACLLSIHEALGNGVGCQDLIPEGEKGSLVLHLASMPPALERAWNQGCPRMVVGMGFCSQSLLRKDALWRPTLLFLPG